MFPLHAKKKKKDCSHVKCHLFIPETVYLRQVCPRNPQSLDDRLLVVLKGTQMCALKCQNETPNSWAPGIDRTLPSGFLVREQL